MDVLVALGTSSAYFYSCFFCILNIVSGGVIFFKVAPRSEGPTPGRPHARTRACGRAGARAGVRACGRLTC
eukprot:7359451-Prymnesium_polylepis.1